MSHYKLLTGKARYHMQYLIVASAYKWKKHGGHMCMYPQSQERDTKSLMASKLSQHGLQTKYSNENLFTVCVWGGGYFSNFLIYIPRFLHLTCTFRVIFKLEKGGAQNSHSRTCTVLKGTQPRTQTVGGRIDEPCTLTQAAFTSLRFSR